MPSYQNALRERIVVIHLFSSQDTIVKSNEFPSFALKHDAPSSRHYCVSIVYKLGVMTSGCQHGTAPQYLANRCTPVSDVPARQRLRSSSRHHLEVLRHRVSTYGRRAFSVAGPSVWNSPPVELRDPDISTDSFRQ